MLYKIAEKLMNKSGSGPIIPVIKITFIIRTEKDYEQFYDKIIESNEFSVDFWKAFHKKRFMKKPKLM